MIDSVQKQSGETSWKSWAVVQAAGDVLDQSCGSWGRSE